MDQLFEPAEITDFEYPLVSGWIPQPPDLRDYTEETPEVKPILEHTGLTPIVNMSPEHLYQKPHQAKLTYENIAAP